MIKVEIDGKKIHEYASGITAGDILQKVYGKKSGAVAAKINGEQKGKELVNEVVTFIAKDKKRPICSPQN